MENKNGDILQEQREGTCDNKYQEEVEILSKEIENLKTRVIEKQNAQQQTQERNKELESKILRLQKENNDKERTITEKEMYLYDLERQKNILADEIKTLKSKTKIQVQLLCKQDEKDMKAIAETLTEALVKKKKVPDLHVIRCMKASEIQDDIPLLLLCFATSEIAQGISTALKGIQVSEKTAVVSVHLKAEHALPDKPSDLVLPIRDFKSLGRIFDIAYTADDGLYQCKMNETNVLGIIDFIYDH